MLGKKLLDFRTRQASMAAITVANYKDVSIIGRI